MNKSTDQVPPKLYTELAGWWPLLSDAVFIHDAIMYMASERDLQQAIETAYLHCAAGGAALFVPDSIRETFRPSTSHGGHDGYEGRGLRYLEWTWEPDSGDETFVVDFVYLLREPSGAVRCVQDRHIEGLFPRKKWLRLMPVGRLRGESDFGEAQRC